MWNILRYPRYW